jgi:hypothetical protein
MERFSVIDHFLLLQHYFGADSDIVKNLYVEHHVDNCSDHDPLFLVLNINVSRIDFANRVSGHRINWSTANCESLFNYSCVLSDRLRAIKLPVDALLCTDLFCSNAIHRSSLNEYLTSSVNHVLRLVRLLFLRALIIIILLYLVGMMKFNL